MEKLFPGIRYVPHRVRRVVLFAVCSFLTVLAVVPIIAFASAGQSCGGGYPSRLCNAPMDSIVDNWGMYNRECVSYTAWKVAHSGRRMPYGFGDANRWPNAARAHHIAVDGTPRVGDVAIRADANHGHSMYVEAVNPDGTLVISQYNVSKTGTFTRSTIKPDDLEFIHF